MSITKRTALKVRIKKVKAREIQKNRNRLRRNNSNKLEDLGFVSKNKIKVEQSNREELQL